MNAAFALPEYQLTIAAAVFTASTGLNEQPVNELD